jgi:ribulose-5-phosphate 4-epimerase/fuculose-1-phosphate aldolase
MHPADQLVVVISRIYNKGLTTTSGGNISIKDDNGDIRITPAGVDKGSLTRRDIVCVKADGTVAGRRQPSEDNKKVAELLKTNPAVMLANDSIVVTGDGLLNTFDRPEVAEFSAQSLIMGMSIGNLQPISDDEVEALRTTFHVE